MTISIITVNYNNKVGLQKTIDSVLCQTWKDFEWIVIDGGSTDGSKELIEQYKQQFVYWCSEPDKGVYHAMNKGIAKAKGEYLNFMNSGDAYYDQDVLQKISNLQTDADIIWGQVVSMDKLKIIGSYCGNLLFQLYYANLCHQGTFIKRVLLNKFPYDESLKIVADWKFWLQTVIWKNVKVEQTNIVVALYDCTGMSSDTDGKNCEIHRMEREMIKVQFFPPLIMECIDEYNRLYKSPYTIYGDYLYKQNHVLFAVGWRILKLLSLLDKHILKCFLHK